jgi:carbon-monoxide dehydrogenase medium subunit
MALDSRSESEEGGMIRQAFSFHAPQSVAEAVRLLGDLGADAKLLAGGQSLVPTLNLGLATPSHVISLNRLRSSLSYIREEGAELALGALTTHHALAAASLVQKHCHALAEAAGAIGDIQIRHRGTIGGSVAHFDPAADYPPVLLALDARFRLSGPVGERVVNAEDFFQGYMTTALGPSELLIEVRVPKLVTGAGSAYAKHQRIEGGFAIVGVAAVLQVQSHACQSIALGVSGGRVIPSRFREVEARYQRKTIDEQWIVEVADGAYAASIDPSSELHASADYKRAMVRVFTQRTLRIALKRAEEVYE